MLTIAKLKRWSINYYNDTAQRRRAGRPGCCRGPMAGWGSTTPNATPAPRCGCAPATPDTAAELVGLTDVAARRRGGRSGGGGALAR